jgi:protein O-GlcNAc transferase
MTIAELFTLALGRHQAGDLRQAEQLYRQVIEHDPRHAEALHYLGVIAHQQGDQERALTLMNQALALNAANPIVHTNLAHVYTALGRLDDAVRCHQETVKLQPHSPLAHFRLAHAFRTRRDLEQALGSFREALRLQPTAAEAHLGLGNVLLEMGRLTEAAESYRQALSLRPDYAEAHSNLGVVLFEQGRMTEAVASYQLAIQARPDYAEAFNNLGNALKELGRLDEAVASFAECLRLRPNFADAHGNLANALTVRGQVSEALASYRQALRLRPDLAWIRTNYLLCLNYDPDASAELLFADHRRWGQLHGQPPRPPVPHTNGPDLDRRLRIGYLGDDFAATAFSCFLQPVLTAHDPDFAQVVCYQKAPVPANCPAKAVTWRTLRGMSAEQVANLIRADGIDVLVDLLGHTRGSWLAVLPFRPAPVQVTWLGYLNTTGLQCVDYRLTDAVADPPGEPVCHTEQLVRLPEVFCCYAAPASAPAVSELPAVRTGRLTFGSHHTLAKLNPRVLDLWSQVLRALPESRLLIFRDTLQGGALQRLLDQFAARGVSPDRIVPRLASMANLAYLALYAEVDVILDAFPWTGHTTTCDALWMGIPVLTLRGTRHAGRMAASVLTAVGLTELIADTPEDFVARAAALAGDLPRLARMRVALRTQMAGSPLCDAPRFTRQLESAYCTMWQEWCARMASGG